MIECLEKHDLLIFLKRERIVAKQILIKHKRWNLGCYSRPFRFAAVCTPSGGVAVAYGLHAWALTKGGESSTFGAYWPHQCASLAHSSEHANDSA
jgi:hypothetical protein